MTVARGMTKGKYVTDAGIEYQTEVDNDFYANTDMAWTSGAGKPKLPRGFKPRHVTGLSAGTGRRSTARVPSVAAALWLGTATTWVGGTNIETSDTYTVIARINEKPSI